MPGLNISRVEAEARSKHLAIASYDVTVKIVPGSETFKSKSIVRFTCNSAGYKTFIDAVSRKIISATLNGALVDISSYDGESVFITCELGENELIIEMDAIFSKNGEGLQYSVDPVDQEPYLYTQGATALTRHWYACFDQPDLKATFALTVVAPTKWEVVGNTPLLSRTEVDSSDSCWQFGPTPRLSNYITALLAGPYHHVHDQYVGEKVVPLGIYVRKSLAKYLDAENIFEITKQGFAFFEKAFGLAYPFEKYDQIAVIDYNWGAMENVGAVTFREELFVFRSKVTDRVVQNRANTILHEMSHMWFGNMVTMRWWDDIWLNESFADWSSHVAQAEGTKYTNAWTLFNVARKNWAYRQDQLTSTHPIAMEMADIEAVNANFDGITYSKGASVIQQLVAHVGRDNFIKGLQTYFRKHAFGSTSLSDLLVELEATSGRDLTQWSATWLKTSGVNTLRPALEFDGDIYSAVAIRQDPPKVPEGSTELRPHRLAVGLYDLKDGVIKLRKSVELDIAGELTPVPELHGEKVADLLLINDGDMTYAKIRFDARSIGTLTQHLGKIEDSLTRALCWSASWDMLRDAEISCTNFVEIALSGLPNEDNITVVTIVCDQLATAVDLYAHPEKKNALRKKVAESFESLMDGSQAGGDFQLQYARAFATLAISPEQNSHILSLLEGGLPGLTIDAELRWHLVNALVERGLYTRAQLDAELAADNTTSGQLSHNFGIAAIPTAEAKAEAWKLMIDEDLPNANRVAHMKGFNRPLHRELVEVYVDNYLAILLDIWAGKSFESASRFVENAFPVYVATQDTLDKTNHWLETTGKDAAPALRRRVIEARDALSRALKVQSVQ